MLIYSFFTFADGNFTKSAIAEFVFANKLPLVTTFTRDSAPLIFESPIKKQVKRHNRGFYNIHGSRIKVLFELQSLRLYADGVDTFKIFCLSCCCLLLQMIQKRLSQHFKKQQNLLRGR